ncbi:MAG: 50S ribosomal protein L29 [Candidatus Sungbacteria bacterium]|nr:50S ribosomal protein L29 [Candidatus Sungbacteria bacterium]
MKELRGKSPEDLTMLLAEKRSRLAELRFLTAQKKIKNVRETGAVRRDAARILTLLKTLTPQP